MCIFNANLDILFFIVKNRQASFELGTEIIFGIDVMNV